MKRMLRMAAGLAVAAATAAVQAADLPDLERGRALYENHCRICHTQQVHERPNRLSIDLADLRLIVDNWQKQERLRWSAQEVDDVVWFLNQTRYRF
ncbi:MAG: cytochrome c [Burkholderiales bacterium]|nr:cytochrome c [Burkholderiales bacterium]